MQLTLSINIAQFCYKIAQISLHHQSSFDEIGFLEREFVSGFKIFFRSTIFRSECLPWLVKMWTPTSRRWKRFTGRLRRKRLPGSNREWMRCRIRQKSRNNYKKVRREDIRECHLGHLRDLHQVLGLFGFLLNLFLFRFFVLKSS